MSVCFDLLGNVSFLSSSLFVAAVGRVRNENRSAGLFGGRYSRSKARCSVAFSISFIGVTACITRWNPTAAEAYSNIFVCYHLPRDTEFVGQAARTVPPRRHQP